MNSRIIIRIELTPPAKKALEGLTEKQGMTQVALLSRLVEWLAHQPDSIRAAVLGQFSPEVNNSTAKLIAQQLLNRKRR